MVPQETLATLREKYQALAPLMDERILRRWAATEALALGWGGASAITKATGLSRTTIRSAIAEPRQPAIQPPPGSGATAPDTIRSPIARRPPRAARSRDPW